jgi:hypothetical protein
MVYTFYFGIGMMGTLREDYDQYFEKVKSRELVKPQKLSMEDAA